jgi:hypothetical protein
MGFDEKESVIANVTKLEAMVEILPPHPVMHRSPDVALAIFIGRLLMVDEGEQCRPRH